MDWYRIDFFRCFNGHNLIKSTKQNLMWRKMWRCEGNGPCLSSVFKTSPRSLKHRPAAREEKHPHSFIHDVLTPPESWSMQNLSLRLASEALLMCSLQITQQHLQTHTQTEVEKQPTQVKSSSHSLWGSEKQAQQLCAERSAARYGDLLYFVCQVWIFQGRNRNQKNKRTQAFYNHQRLNDKHTTKSVAREIRARSPIRAAHNKSCILVWTGHCPPLTQV